MLSAVCRLPSAVCCRLCAVCCRLSAVGCLLFAVCCLLSAVICFFGIDSEVPACACACACVGVLAVVLFSLPSLLLVLCQVQLRPVILLRLLSNPRFYSPHCYATVITATTAYNHYQTNGFVKCMRVHCVVRDNNHTHTLIHSHTLSSLDSYCFSSSSSSRYHPCSPFCCRLCSIKCWAHAASYD